MRVGPLACPGNTVGRNLANQLIGSSFHDLQGCFTSQVVQEFFHQPYVFESTAMKHNIIWKQSCGLSQSLISLKYHGENSGALGMVPLLFDPPRSPLRGDIL